MELYNWIAIAPFLVMIIIAIALMPLIHHANKKFSKMARDVRENRRKDENNENK